MTENETKSAPACESQDYYVVMIDGKPRRIAHDHRQPGGKNRSRKAFSVVGSVFRAAEEIRKRDAELD
jgi:hypothetical protein